MTDTAPPSAAHDTDPAPPLTEPHNEPPSCREPLQRCTLCGTFDDLTIHVCEEDGE